MMVWNTPSLSIPCTRARRVLRSPRTSPMCASGTVTSSSTTGSRSAGWASRNPSRKAILLAVRNAFSLESTECIDPSKTTTRTSPTG